MAVGAEAYEVAALALRYWFVFLGLLIVWRSFSWLKKDRQQRKNRLQKLPDAGLIGELVVISGTDSLPTGTILPAPREGTLGNHKICDIYLPVAGIKKRHADFRFKNGLGFMLFPARGQKLLIDDKTYDKKDSYGLMHHGSKLIINQVVLRLRLFVGLETSQSTVSSKQEHADFHSYLQETFQQNLSQTKVDPQEEPWFFSTQPYIRTPRQWADEESYQSDPDFEAEESSFSYESSTKTPPSEHSFDDV
ncbi:MAG: FHA domain-containing protein [Clostridiales bacterium]|nr:FHA domain-containing protein [Clostridiales bacterium]